MTEQGCLKFAFDQQQTARQYGCLILLISLIVVVILAIIAKFTVLPRGR